MRRRARNVAMAFEGYSLYPPLTVRENIAFALKRARLSASEVSRRVQEVAALVEIEPILDRYPNSISGGQQQRASLARALVRDAALYVLDEPMGQLEPQLRAVLRGRLKRLLKDRAMTSIFVTHDQTEANALADRIAVMEGGVLQQFAPQHVLKERPANLYVATFIGEPPMNVFDAAVVRDDGRTTFELDNGPSLRFGDNELGPEVRKAIGDRSRIVIGVRPHRVVLGNGSAESARVVSNQWLGDQSHVAMAVAGKLLVAVSHARVRAAIGDSVPYARAGAGPSYLRSRHHRRAGAWSASRMMRDLIIGLDAGTSVLKSVAFTIDGAQVGMASRPNSYTRFGRGCVEQDMLRTWDDARQTLCDLAAVVPNLAERVVALAVTGQGDGCWLIDADGEPVGDGLIWLDSRAAEMAAVFVAGPDHAAHYATTGTGLNACQQSIQFAWMQQHQPERLQRATTALHCKDWLYFKLTGVRAVDPSEAVFTYGDFRSRSYAPEIMRAARHCTTCRPAARDRRWRTRRITASPTPLRPQRVCRAGCPWCSAMSMSSVRRLAAGSTMSAARSAAPSSARPACICG